MAGGSRSRSNKPKSPLKELRAESPRSRPYKSHSPQPKFRTPLRGEQNSASPRDIPPTRPRKIRCLNLAKNPIPPRADSDACHNSRLTIRQISGKLIVTDGRTYHPAAARPQHTTSRKSSLHVNPISAHRFGAAPAPNNDCQCDPKSRMPEMPEQENSQEGKAPQPDANTPNL